VDKRSQSIQSKDATGSFRYRILMVDDDLGIRTVAKAILQLQGYEVLTAADGFDGLTKLKQSLPDVVISDLRMPNMNGFEFLSVVRRRFPGIAVIAISGEFTGTEVPVSVLADAFLEKGQYSPETLFEKITELLQEIPQRPRAVTASKAAVWIPVKDDADYVAVTCSACLRTFPVEGKVLPGVRSVDCDFCGTKITFEVGHGGLLGMVA
jgi:CheY-like chemotaxis protein